LLEIAAAAKLMRAKTNENYSPCKRTGDLWNCGRVAGHFRLYFYVGIAMVQTHRVGFPFSRVPRDLHRLAILLDEEESLADDRVWEIPR